MSSATQGGAEEIIEPGQAENALQQILIRLTSPQVRELQNELARLQAEIRDLRQLEGDTAQLHHKLENINLLIAALEMKLVHLGDELRDRAMVESRLEATVVPVLNTQARERGDDVAEALAPVMGTALRRQIRDAREDIIEALYPVIGQIIGKAISEALRELTRNIDTRLRQQLNFRDRLGQTRARLQGVSEAEYLLRDALPYSVERVFLVHRHTGLLLSHIAVESAADTDMDTISGMLTAIQDFVRDSFNGGEGNLEEITHGGRRILLESGRYAYVAVVLSGVEPVGYNNRIRDCLSEIHFKHESDLKSFDGNMQRLPDFGPVLRRLVASTTSPAPEAGSATPLSTAQKRVLGIGLFAGLLLVGLTIFACFFVVRLWPVAFPNMAPVMPAPTSTPGPQPTAMPSFTLTSIPTVTISFTSTAVPTLTPMPSLTSTARPSPTQLAIGLLTGNLNVRSGPSDTSPALGGILAGEKVLVLDEQNGWYQIRWPVEGVPQIIGWVNGKRFLEFPIAATP